MRQAMKFFLSAFLIFLLSSCSVRHDTTTRQKDKSVNVIGDANLRKIANRNANNTILLLLPLSGANARLGRGALNACILSAREARNKNVDFVVVDTADRFLDRSRFYSVLKNRSLRAIIGPVFCNEARRYGALFSSVPMFTFSNNAEVNNNHIFACGLNPQSETDEIFSYARKKKIGDFLVMLPKGKYGDEIEQCIKISMKKFNFSEEDDAEIIRYESIGRREATDYAISSGKRAIFIVDPIIDNEQLPENTSVFTLSAHALQNKEAWRGSTFAFSNIQKAANFSSKYEAVFGNIPSALDMVGYDLTNALCGLASDAQRPFVFENKKFHGCLGDFTFARNKGIKRELRLYKSD